MSNLPIFMSPQHVDILNRRLRESVPVARLCAELDRDLCLLYDLHDGPGGEQVHWRTDFRRSSGIEFSLEPGSGVIDVIVLGRYWDAIDAAQGRGQMPTPQGSAADIEDIMRLLAAPELRSCAVSVTFPMPENPAGGQQIGALHAPHASNASEKPNV